MNKIETAKAIQHALLMQHGVNSQADEFGRVWLTLNEQGTYRLAIGEESWAIGNVYREMYGSRTNDLIETEQAIYVRSDADQLSVDDIAAAWATVSKQQLGGTK